MLLRQGAVFKDEADEALVSRFVSAVQKARQIESELSVTEAYPDNPFHNFGHAVDVQAVIACSVLEEMTSDAKVKSMKLMEADAFLSNLAH